MIRQRAVAAAAAVLGVIALLPLLARLAGGRPLRARGRGGAVAVQAAALTPAAAVASVAAVGLGAVAAWWLAALLAVPAALLVARQLPGRRRGGGQAPQPGSTEMLRLLTLNALVGRADPAAVVAAVAACDADVLAVQELTPELADGLAAAGLGSLLPNCHADPRPRVPGAGLWTRWPLEPLPPVPGLDLASPGARLTLPSGAPVTVRAVHIVAPMRGLHPVWHADLRALRDALADAKGMHVVAGDFNATTDHRPFRDLLAAGYADCADIARYRSWPGFTWPAARRWVPPVMRIDHVLVSAGITVREARTVSVPGTDHLGVLAALELPL